ncbi:MAG: metallophosphoesterase [Mesosutterella sp.]|nr:metallophosphoesterase [Mesosutterella sp.]
MYTSYYWALGALGLYTALRIYSLLRGRGLLQISAAVFAALSYAVYPILVVMGITRPWGDGMHIAIVVSGFFFSAAFLETLLLVLRDLWLALRWAAGKIRRRISGDSFSLSFAPERKRSAALPAFFAFLAFAGAAYGTWQTQRLPLIREVEIPIPRLPSSMDGLRIVQLTDVHLSPLFAHRRIVRIVEAAQTLKPDLIVVTGDIADGTPQARLADARVLVGLQKSAPVVMVPGNHDYYVDFAAWRECYRSLGLPLLENGSARLTLRGGSVTVAGLTDRSGELRGFPGPDISKALSDAAPDALRIALIHRPENPAPQADPRWKVDLELAGHTHGSQMLFLWPMVALQNHGYVHGLYRFGSMPLYVSAGFGLWSGAPMRLGVPPELTLITLRSAQAAR